MAIDGGPRRTYRSELRIRQAESTRRAVLDAACRLFSERGWASVGMRDVAQEAGVSTETLYAHFGSKAALFGHAAEIAVVGDDAPEALAARPQFTALGHGTRQARLRAAARVAHDVNRRTAGLAKVLREAAPAEPQLAEMLASARSRQRADVATAARLVLGRDVDAATVDDVWVLTGHEVYDLLVGVCGWTGEHYEDWLTDKLDAALPGAADDGRKR